MKRPVRHVCIAAVFCAFLQYGCAVSGKITDFTQKTTYVSSLRLDNPRTLILHDGNAIREIRLDRINTLRIDAEKNAMFGRQQYYLAEIVLRDGTMIGSLDGKRARAYIAVDQYLYGKTGKNNYRIMLNDVSKIEFLVK